MNKDKRFVVGVKGDITGYSCNNPYWIKPMTLAVAMSKCKDLEGDVWRNDKDKIVVYELIEIGEIL